MRLFRRATAPPPPEPRALPEPSLWDRVCFWRAEFRRLAQTQPSVDEVQARDQAEQEHRNAVGVERIAKAVARTGAWFPHDP